MALPIPLTATRTALASLVSKLDCQENTGRIRKKRGALYLKQRTQRKARNNLEAWFLVLGINLKILSMLGNY